MPIEPDKKPNPSNLAHGNYEKPPQSTIDEMRAKLARYDRSPYTDFLALVMQTLPSFEALKELAEKDPYKHAKVVATHTQLAGYVVEKKEVQHTVSFEHMSDLELLAYVQAQRKAIPLQPIEAEATTVDAIEKPQ